MAGNKAEKAKDELRWNDARSFAKGLEEWAGSGKPTKTFRKCFLNTLGSSAGRKVRAQYKMAPKGERLLFLKCAMHFVYAAGGGKGACSSLAGILFRMADEGARLGELYEYVLQNPELEHGEGRLGKIQDAMDSKGLGKEYYEWFAGEFGTPAKTSLAPGMIPISISSAKELVAGRRAVDFGALERRLHAPRGTLAGTAVIGRIREYLETGRFARLSFRNRETAANIAHILYESGIGDILPSGNHITLGLREKIYAAKGAAREGGWRLPPEKLLEYFLGKGLGEARAMEIAGLIDSGQDSRALGEMCKFALRECRNQYICLGERRRAFGKRGAEMLASFKEYAGGNVSLMGIYDMVERGEYAPALRRLREIFGAIDLVSGEYPLMFA